MANFKFGVTALLLLCSSLTGCATRPAAMYQWQGYQAGVNTYLRGDKAGPDVQAQTMAEGLQKIQANGGAVPPGYNAHLGLLYGQQGNLDKFVQHVQAEKKQFPESEVFMDFLLRNFKNKGGAS